MTRAIAERTGRINARYRTRDGRYIIDGNDLKRLRMTAEEYVTGLQGIERINDTEAKRLIALGGRAMGVPRDEEKGTESKNENIEEEDNDGNNQ